MAALEERKAYVVTVRGPGAILLGDLSSTTTVTKKVDSDQIAPLWNDLPVELVGEIMAKLSSADLIRFAACCRKFWSLMPNYTSREIDLLPWLVKPYLQLSSGWEFELFDPLHITPYSYMRVDEITGQLELSSSSNDDGGGRCMKLLASQHGWLLWSWEKQQDQQQIIEQQQQQDQPPLVTITHSFLVVSPFTKQFINLPDLEQSVRLTIRSRQWFGGQIEERENRRSMVAAFSAKPSSSPGGCIYFVLHAYETDRYHVTVSTCRNGDSEWKTVRLNAMSLPPFFDGAVTAVYHDGNFYCCKMVGYLIGAYDVVGNQWKRLLGHPQPTEEFSRKYLFPGDRHNRHSYLLVCEGKLLFVLLYIPRVKNFLFPGGESKGDRCLVYGYSEQGDWVEKTSLGDYALFLCPRGSFSVSASSATSDIANRVYYYRPCRGDGKKHYYSIEDDKSYPCGGSSYYWPGIDDAGTWIKPPQLHPV